MVDLDELSAQAVGDPPAVPCPMAELERRARRRRWRRRGVVGGLAAVMVLAGAGVGVRAGLVSSDGSADVVTAGAEGRGHGLGTGKVVWPDGNPGWSRDEFLDAVTRELLRWPDDTAWHVGPDGRVFFASTSRDADVDRWVEMTVDEVDGSWRIVGDPDLNYEIGVTERDGQAAVNDRLLTPPDTAMVEVRWVDSTRGEQWLDVTVEDLASQVEGTDGVASDTEDRPVIVLPGTEPEDLGSVLVIPRSADGQAITVLFGAFDDPARERALERALEPLPDGALTGGGCSRMSLPADPDVNELERVGLSDTVPRFLVAQFTMYGMQCSGGRDPGIGDFVTYFVVHFWSGDTRVASWLLSGERAGVPGGDYLETSPDARGADVYELGDGIILVPPSDHAEAIRSEIAQVGSSDFVSLWSELVADDMP
jgi:hypothetical protein